MRSFSNITLKFANKLHLLVDSLLLQLGLPTYNYLVFCFAVCLQIVIFAMLEET